MKKDRLTAYDEKKQEYKLTAKSCCGGPDFYSAIQKLGAYEDDLSILDLKFKIGDKVLVKKPHSGNYQKPEPFIALIGGFVITKNKRSTTIRYTLEPLDDKEWPSMNSSISDWNRKKRYNASELEKIKD